jgi:hypothetical protein
MPEDIAFPSQFVGYFCRVAESNGSQGWKQATGHHLCRSVFDEG